MIGGRSALLSVAGGGNPYGNWTGNYENVSLLLRNGVPTLIPIDESPVPKDIAIVGGPSMNTTLFKYGNSALDFPGVSDNHYSIFGLNNFTPGLGAWTVEAWVYRKSAANWVIMSGSNFYVNGTSTQTVVGDNSVNRILISSVPALNTWVHVATVRESNGTIRLFFNGIQQASSTGSLSTATTTGILIGGRTAGVALGTDALLDDVRVTVGVARYTDNFTPPTAELPANITDDPNYNDVSLLLRNETLLLIPADESPRPKYISIVGNARVTTEIAKWNQGSGGGSISFWGGVDYLTTPIDTDFDFGTGDFTIEFWARHEAVGGTIQTYFNLSTGSANIQGFSIYRSSTQVVFAYFAQSQTPTFSIASAAGTILSDTWYHIAVTRNGTTFSLFVDGVTVGTPVTSSASMYNGRTPSIGYWTGYGRPLSGYIDDLRITKGIARYVGGTGENAGKMVFAGTNDLALPTAELPANITEDPSYNNVSLLLKNGTFYLRPLDESPTPKILTGGGTPEIVTSIAKWDEGSGGSSVSFDGVSDYWTATGNYAFGTSNFTIECWVRLNQISTTQSIMAYGRWADAIGQTSDGYQSWVVRYSSTTGFTGVITTTTALYVTNPEPISPGLWYHLAFVRFGTQLSLYVNGVAGPAVTSSLTMRSLTGNVGLRIGIFDTNSKLLLNGYLDDIRITGGIARYTKNFLPPPAELPAI